MTTERVPTGIPGFDKLVQGGFPKGSAVLLSGTPGTGKTLFALQYLYNGATKSKERGAYVSFEENRQELLEQASQFGWDLEKLEKEGLLSIITVTPDSIGRSTAKEILELIQEHKVQRLVIDSLTTLAVNVPTREGPSEVSGYSMANFLYRFLGTVKKMDTTTLLISQASDEGVLASDTVSAFVSTGVVHITFESLGSQYSRSLLVRKMRRTRNDEDIHPLEISAKGLVVHSIQ
ncbi:AAA family ATPase [Candidatus Woesearchaeota archaeon]|nr:AAA family ATPase [Candidatus Woesearchaeota archaeon]